MNNILILVGRITKDLELKNTSSDKKVLNVNLAITNSKDDTTFITLTAFGKNAEMINNYSKKGDLIGVQAIIKNHNWVDKNNVNHYDYSFLVNRITFLQNKNKEYDDLIEINNKFLD